MKENLSDLKKDLRQSIYKWGMSEPGTEALILFPMINSNLNKVIKKARELERIRLAAMFKKFPNGGYR
jgi:hypothetical protein